MPFRPTIPAVGAVGLTLIELMFALAAMSTLAALAVPASRDAVDDLRTAMAARYLSGRLMQARVDAIKASTAFALRFQVSSTDYRFAAFRDGNGNGVRTIDIQGGVDPAVSGSEQLADKFAGVRFGLLPGIPDADGTSGTGTDGVRIGTARILTLSPDGTATAGTLYLHGRRGQFAVRVLGATARIRVLQFDRGSRQWVTR